MLRKRRTRSTSPNPAKCWIFVAKTIAGLLIVTSIGNCQADYLMGGHLDNKDNNPPTLPTTDQTTKITDPKVSPIDRKKSASSRSSMNYDDLDRDFDLGLDLLAEPSSSHPSRVATSDFSEDPERPKIDEKSATATRYRVPLVPYAFNGGQPFSLEKDPITGQIDFEKAPPLKVVDLSAKTSENSSIDDFRDTDHAEKSNENDSTVQTDDGVGPNEINPYSPSFHDFLNLPSRYTYDKYENTDKYPLISNSYANTKVQSGTNSYNTYNHKKYHEIVKSSVNAHLQPSRKTHVTQSVTKKSSLPSATKFGTSSSTLKPITIETTTPTATTTKKPSTTTSKPATTLPTFNKTTKQNTDTPKVTTWKPQKVSQQKFTNDDYETKLPIERLQPISTSDRQSTTTPPSRYVAPPLRPSKPNKFDTDNDDSNEYEEGYDDYDHAYQTGMKQSVANDHNESDGDYSYGMDLFGLGSFTTSKTPETTTVTEKSVTTISTMPTTISTTTDSIETSSTDKLSNEQENRTTTMKPIEEKRVTSMPLDTTDRPYIGNYPTNVQSQSNENTAPNVASNVVYHQLRPTSNNDRYYGRPSMLMPAPGIVVKSTSNVVVPPGQDTVSFVLGNRQSVGNPIDNANAYYPIHSGSMNDRQGVSYGQIVDEGPMNNPDNYPGQMIVSAGIGVGTNSGGSYPQRPQSTGTYDHSLVSVGLPTVDVVNPGDGVQSNLPNNPESSTPTSQDALGPQWWSSTSYPINKPQQNTQQESSNAHNDQFNGYRVVFPDAADHDDKSGGSGTSGNTDKSSPNVDEHVIVVHETEIGPGNTLHLELPSQSTSTQESLIASHYDATTQRFTPKPDDQGLPELSESLTPPAEHPNRVQQQLHRPSNYNYYHHQSHTSGNSRPNDYPRPQRVPLPPLPPSPSSSSSSSSPSSSGNGFKRRPSTNPDANLPNILPQFRPNAKVSQGHNRGDNVGTIPAGAMGHYPNPLIRRPLPPHHHHHHHHHRPATSRRPGGPSHLQRLNPPPLPALSPPINSLRLPTPAALVAQAPGTSTQHDSPPQNSEPRPTIQKRLHQVNVGNPPALNIDERHQSPGFGSQQPQAVKSRLEDDNLERFSAEPPQQPPRAPFFGKRGPIIGNDEVSPGVPQVATLQMIQQHGGDDSIVKSKLPPPYRIPMDERQTNRHRNADSKEVDAINGNDSHKDSSIVLPLGDQDTRSDYADTVDSPVYVVYPVKGALDIRPTSHENDDPSSEEASVVVGKYGPQRPLPPDTLLKNNNEDSSTTDDNTNYRPSVTTFTDSSAPQLASDFPYPLERPDPSLFTSQLSETPLLVPSEQSKDVDRNDEKMEIEDHENLGQDNQDGDRDASVNVIPYPQDHIPFELGEQTGPISATLHRLGGISSIMDSSSTPIAWVYTPTVRPPIRRQQDEVYGHSNFERTPVLLQSQHSSSVSSSGPAAPQSFMAPFVASANAEAPSKNGWSVVKVGDKIEDNDSTSQDRRRADTDVTTDDNKDSDIDDGEETKNLDKKMEERKNVTMTNTTEIEEDAKHDKMADGHGADEKITFNLENFTPQLFGGFKPIYEFPSDGDTDPTLGDKVTGGAPAIERPRFATENAKMAARKLENV